MKDCLGNRVFIGSALVYVTLHGHKPVLNYALALEVEESRVQVAPVIRSTGCVESDKPRWLHQSENFVVVG